MKIKKYVLFAVIALSCAACKKDNKDNNSSDELLPYKQGVFITCEGPFQTGTGTVSFINRYQKTVSNDIFQTVNNRPLGNVVQSMTLYNDKAFIVVNNAGKVEVVTYGDFKSVGTINGFTSPRYVLVCTVGLNTVKMFVSDMSGFVAVVDMNTYTITKSIQTGHSPDNMASVDNKLFVLNYGGLGTDSTITVINADRDTVETTLYVHYKPNSVFVDANKKLWVMCGGKGFTSYPQADDTEGHLMCIDPATYNVIKDIAFPTTGDHPEHMVYNNESSKIYYLDNNKVYDFDLSSATLNTNALISKSFYALGYDAIEDYIYAGDPLDYASDGWVYRYHPDSGIKVDSFKVGIIPGNFYFN